MKHDESKIQAAIVKHLSAEGIFCHSVPNEAAGSNRIRQGQMITMGLRPGVADLVVWLPEGIAYVEVKTATGRQSPAQVRFQERCERAGIRYYLVRSVEDVQKILYDKR